MVFPYLKVIDDVCLTLKDGMVKLVIEMTLPCASLKNIFESNDGFGNSEIAHLNAPKNPPKTRQIDWT